MYRTFHGGSHCIPYRGISTSTGIISSEKLAILQRTSTVAPWLHCWTLHLSSLPPQFSLESKVPRFPHFFVMGRRGIVHYSLQELFILLELHLSPKSQINLFFLHSNNPTVCWLCLPTFVRWPILTSRLLMVTWNQNVPNQLPQSTDTNFLLAQDFPLSVSFLVISILIFLVFNIIQ